MRKVGSGLIGSEVDVFSRCVAVLIFPNWQVDEPVRGIVYDVLSAICVSCVN